MQAYVQHPSKEAVASRRGEQGTRPSIGGRRSAGHIGGVSGLDESRWVKGWATSEALAFFAERAPAPFWGSRA